MTSTPSIIILTCLFSWNLNSQRVALKNLPLNLSQAFQLKYPEVKKVSWEKENSTEYEAEFVQNSKETSVLFDASGRWLSSETALKPQELPNNVKEAINKQFMGYKIEEACLKNDPTQGEHYEVELEKGKTEYKVTFKLDGMMINSKEDGDDDNDSDD
ncbi:MAG: PepSY-like domain-containing protein [Bacteroidota bacterium]|nr:PepSY-like domain-containing protein [Bacteroidota bacterium]